MREILCEGILFCNFFLCIPASTLASGRMSVTVSWQKDNAVLVEQGSEECFEIETNKIRSFLWG